MFNEVLYKLRIKKRPVELQGVPKAQAHVNDALSMFSEAVKRIDAANEILDDVRASNISQQEFMRNRIAEIDQEVLDIEKQKSANCEIRDNLSKFCITP